MNERFPTRYVALVNLDELYGSTATFTAEHHGTQLVLDRKDWESLGRPSQVSVTITEDRPF